MKNKEKDVVSNKTKKNKKEEKLFTKKESKVTIRKNYNPLKVNYKIYERGSGLCMENIVLNNLKKELNLKNGTKEKVVEILFQKCKELNYNIDESKEIIIEFYKDKLLVQNLSINL